VASAPAETTLDLFRAANQARGERRVTDAIDLYRALQARFPSSPEAGLSRLSLGELLLGHGDAAGALGELDAYLGGDDAILAEEALFARARALHQLGRADEERTAWRALLIRFPSSGYAWRARQRLARLAGSAP
jgi:TolA-binding protein